MIARGVGRRTDAGAPRVVHGWATGRPRVGHGWATGRPRVGHACPPPGKRLVKNKDFLSKYSNAKRAGGAHPWPTRGLPVAHPPRTRGPPVDHTWHRRQTCLGWAPPKRDVLVGGKIFGGQYVRKIVLDVHGRIRVHSFTNINNQSSGESSLI